jgi:hypothetical protein
MCGDITPWLITSVLLNVLLILVWWLQRQAIDHLAREVKRFYTHIGELAVRNRV